MDTKKILAKLKIGSLNPMQEEALQTIEKGGDTLILSPTGSGKTLAYLLPTIGQLDSGNDQVQALVIVPGRELALQSDMVMRKMGCGLRSASCYGGRTAMDEHKMLKTIRPQLIFGTPGRINDHIDKGNISPYEVRILVIDEFDKCLEMGFRDEMSRLIKKLPGIRQRILLSATEAEEIPHFLDMGKTTRLDYLDASVKIPQRVTLYKVDSPSKDKLETLALLLRSLGEESSIVFLNYRDSVERTADYLQRQGFSLSYFHGGLDQKLREDALYKFSNGSTNIFVSTDLASRGLDIPEIGNIIHYHLPQGEDEYIHRVGRTARWNAKGKSFFILAPGEEIPDFVDGDINSFRLPDCPPPPAMPKMATIYIGKGKKDKISRGDIVGFLCKKGGLESNDIGRIDVKERYAYVAIKHERLQVTLKNVEGEKIKGIKTIVEIVK